ncbi:uncharacterized protein LOC142983738 [Anticarsia gemmatalis]|uniref:uncharacterized protein LOC142983738 n=1 Tax=Anticarsia gemmatalis TaxID=129554 RepID=UPI003F767BD8
MFQYKISSIFFVTMMMIIPALSHYVNTSHPRPWKVRYYPKKTVFKKSDLIDKGCDVFIRNCPKAYKLKTVCARHYDGYYKTFPNYCAMEYDNCNSWRQWSLLKQERC